MNPAETGSFSFGVVSCVKNNDPNNPLYVRWLIPGPDGWAPQGEHLDSGPRLRKDNQVQQYDGCLQYGNRGDMTKGLFLGIDGDKAKIDDELARGCRAVAASTGEPKTGGIEKLITRVRNFFPSDPTNPAKTMLQFDGTIGIQPKGPDSFESFVSYSVVPLRRQEDGRTVVWSDGSVVGITISPEFQGNAETLLPAFRQSNPENVKITEKGVITFQASDVKNPVLSYGSYAFHDREGRRLGAIEIPLFVSRN